MKGSPLREVVILLLAGLLLLWPLQRLTRAPVAVVNAATAVPGPPGHLTGAWLEVRATAVLPKIRIFQQNRLLWEGGGEARLDADLQLDLSESRDALRVEFRWPESTEPVYAELTLEPDGLSARREGFWSSDGDSRVWEIPQEESP